MIPDFTVSTFRGLNTLIKDLKTLKPGVASSSNNWITGKYGETIELRSGIFVNYPLNLRAMMRPGCCVNGSSWI
jgi:hypothetical protein